MKRELGLLLYGLSLILGISGCLKDQNIISPITASVQIYHSSPDAPDLNIAIDQKVITEQPFKYKNYTNYIDVEPGARNFRFNTFTGGSNLVDSTLHFLADSSYSLFVVNTLSKIELIRTFDVAHLPSPNHGMVRFVNLSPDAPTIEIALKGPQNSSAFSAQAFKQASAFKEVFAEVYTMEVKVKGGSGVTITIPEIKILEMGYYTILVEGFDIPKPDNKNSLSARVIGSLQ